MHKQKISYCVKDSSGKIYAEGWIPATRFDLDRWMKTLPQPWSAAMEATMFSGWIYDHLKPHGAELKVAHPLMLRAIAAAKKKNDRIDANKICDCLRCDFLPECYMAPTAIRERRRIRRRERLPRAGGSEKDYSARGLPGLAVKPTGHESASSRCSR